MEVDTVLCGECSEILSVFPENCIDAVISSPPYGKIRDYNGYSFDFPNIAAQLYRVLKVGGILVWVRTDTSTDSDESCESFDQVYGFRRAGFKLHDTMIWSKPSFPPAATTLRYYQAFEYMFILLKGDSPKTFHPITVPSKTFGTFRNTKGQRRKDGTWRERRFKPVQPMTRLGNVWQMDFDRGAKEHPAAFPRELVKMHLQSWSNPGDLILDPCCGSGTTLAVAKAMGRKFIGIDISERYCELSRQWLEQIDDNSS